MLTLHAHGYSASIDEMRGGSCVRLERFGAQVLRSPESAQSYETSAFLYGTPLLFYPNRISGGCFEFENRVYRLPVNEPSTGCFLHGTLHQTSFDVVESGADFAVLRYAATAQKPYLTFPHAFTLTLTWRITESGLCQTVVFRNDSPLNMPVALAFHTTFRLPFCANSRAQDVLLTLDAAAEYSRDMSTYLPDGGYACDYPDKQALTDGTFIPAGKTISRFFRMGEARRARLTDESARIRVTYQAHAPYAFWMVYNGGSQDFLCIEPQSWLSNCPNAPFPREEHGFDFIAPGKTRAYETALHIERI